MPYTTIASFENESHTYEVHKQDIVLLQAPNAGENAYFVVRDDGQQHGAFWDDEDRAIEDAEDWAGPEAERLF